MKRECYKRGAVCAQLHPQKVLIGTQCHRDRFPPIAVRASTDHQSHFTRLSASSGTLGN